MNYEKRWSCIAIYIFLLFFHWIFQNKFFRGKAKSKNSGELCQQRIWPQVSFCIWWIDSLVPVAKGSRWKKFQWQFCSSCMLQQNTKYYKEIFSSYNSMYQMRVSGRKKCPFSSGSHHSTISQYHFHNSWGINCFVVLPPLQLLKKEI